MSFLLKILGVGLICAAAAVFFGEYKKQLEGRRDACQGFLSLLSHIRRQIDCFLTPMERLLHDFSDEFLEKCGYLERAGKIGIREAFFEMKDKFPLPKEAAEILQKLFSTLGRDYREGTVRELDLSISSLEKCLAKEKDDSEKDLKIAGILAASVALGIIILIV